MRVREEAASTAAEVVRTRREEPAAEGLQGSLGNRIVQRLASGAGSTVSPGRIRAAAARGVADAVSPFPHGATIERAFGPHARGMRAHCGPVAAASARGIRAVGYASGEDVVFARPPTLREAAHEAAHVVQQRHGHAPHDGIGAPGDRHEREADAVAEDVTAGRSPQPRLDGWARTPGSRAPAVQLLRDGGNQEIDIQAITSLGTARNALARVQSNEYTAEDGDVDALNERIEALHETLGDQLADSTLGAMNTMNTNGKVMYTFNAQQHRPQLVNALTQAGQDPLNGYASATHFTRTSAFTWHLKPNISASAALRAFLDPGGTYPITIVECQTSAQAAFYKSILDAVGDKAFDARFGRADAVTPEANRLRLEKNFSPQNPLKNYLEDPTLDVENDDEANELLGAPNGAIVSAPNNRPARRGGWYFLANHPKYMIRHPDGVWVGENAFYKGRDEGDDSQHFTGFGVADETETGLAGTLAGSFNQAPTAHEVELILKRTSDDWPLLLPRLGDLGSLNDLPALSNKAMEHLGAQWLHHAPKPNEIPAELTTRPHALAALREILKDKPLIAPIQAQDLLSTFNVVRPSNAPTQVIDAPQGVWSSPARGNTTLTLKKKLRVSRASLTISFAKQFGLIFVGQLIQKVRELNTPTLDGSEAALINIPSGTVLNFPNPADVSKLTLTLGGFQSWGEKVLSTEKVGQLART